MTSGCPTLRSLAFSDLLLGERQGPLVKGLCPSGGGSSPLGPLPSSFHAEARQIQAALASQSKDEFAYVHDGIRYRVSRIVTVDGIWYCLRRGPATIESLEGLGISAVIRQRLCSAEMHHGLVVFSGAMRSGKTTTASALVAERLRLFGGHAVALESPPEHPLQGPHGHGFCLQKEVEGDLENAIVATLRYGAPEIIFLGELRSSGEVAQALRAAINGHLVITTFHAAGVQETIRRLLALGRTHEPLAQELLADGLRCVVHQNLQGKSLRLQFLFLDGSRIGQAATAKIREGEIGQMATEIQAQKNEILFGLGC